MQPTLIGLIVLVVGFYIMVARRIEAMFAFTMGCMLLGGSSAINVSALGNASIAPAQLALGFLMLRVILPNNVEHTKLRVAAKANIWLTLYVVYAIVSAMILPRLFARRIDVVPMRPTGIKHLYDAFPLVPTSQNVTTTIYTVGTCLFALAAYIAVRQPSGPIKFVKTSIVVTWIHVATGLLGLIVPKSIWDAFLAVVRNGSYAQLDQTVQGFSRIAGIMPEASSYAAFGFVWFVFMAELWLRDVLPRRTGPAAAAIASVLTISTSSTAYVGIGGYAAFLVIRLLINPQLIPFSKMIWILMLGFAAMTAGAAAYVFVPGLAQQLADLLKHFTVDKVNSSSGLQRAFWAKQGLYAFKASYGLGIGAGSFRSSSIITAVIGSVGVIGSATMLLYLASMFLPLRRSTFGHSIDRVEAAGVAASWTALCFFIPAAVAWPSPDPGMIFALFASAAIALRTLPRPANRPTAAPDPVGSVEALA